MPTKARTQPLAPRKDISLTRKPSVLERGCCKCDERRCGWQPLRRISMRWIKSRNGFAKCEAKAARTAEQAAGAPQAGGDAAFIETYARSLPNLMIAGLNAHEKDLRVFAQTTRDNLQ